MGTDQLQHSRGFITISLIAVLFVLAAACGGEAANTTASSVGAAPSAEAEHPPSSPTAVPAATSAAKLAGVVISDGESWELLGVRDSSSDADTAEPGESDPTEPPAISLAAGPTIQPVADPTEHPLINTPGPVANTAPDFTLPSIQGVDYTLSQFRGDRPVAIVFYRAYW